MNRRTAALALALVLIAGAGAWAGVSQPWHSESSPPATVIAADDDAVAAAEEARRGDSHGLVEVDLTAAPATVDLGGRTVDTWAFNGQVPGPEIRVRAGDVLRANVSNELPEPLTIHWHGIALRNDMDGVPALTQPAIDPGAGFVYEFSAPDPGTYFYHPHTGTQLDRGLYGALIVEDPGGRVAETPEATVLVDDWVDGTGRTPDDVFGELTKTAPSMGHDMSNMNASHAMSGMGTQASDEGPSSSAAMLGTDTGDIDYPLYLVNGRTPDAPGEMRVRAGEALRLRLINAGSDTPFRVAVGGSKLTVVATDGFATKPFTVDTLIIGMGERYDVLATMPADGAFPLVAKAEGKTGGGLLALRTGDGPTPDAASSPAELAGTLLRLADLESAAAVTRGAVDRRYTVRLTGSMAPYEWGMNGDKVNGVTLPVRQGDLVRLTIDNTATMMWHPVHLHGHTFRVVDDGVGGPLKDTVIVPPMGKVTVEFVAENPGQWALHCHNIYHAEAGMVTVLSYVK